MHRKLGALFALLALGFGVFALASPASAYTSWSSNGEQGAEILGPNRAKVFSGNNSLENGNLGITVEAGDFITFHYELKGEQTCGGGAPRAFVEIDGAYHNTWDHDAGASTCASGDVSYELPVGGVVGHAGLVNDKDHESPVKGAVVFSNLTIGGHRIFFTGNEVTPKRPTKKDATCDDSGSINIPEVKGVFYKLDGARVEAGTYEVDARKHAVEAFAKRHYELTDSKRRWVLRVAAAENCEPSPSPSGSPSTDPSTSPSADPSASTTPPVKVTDGPDDLPTTGFGALPLIIGSGAALVLSGAGILLLIARRKGWLYS